MKRTKLYVLSAMVVACCFASCGVSATAAVVEDRFGRDATVYGLVLPDWEGYMANPAIEFAIAPPPGAALPVKVTVAGSEPRLYFDLPSEAGANGPRKSLTLNGSASESVFVAIFPARKKHAQETSLGIMFEDARGRRGRLNVPIHVVPIESGDSSPILPIIVDFSQDRTGFFKDATHRRIFEQAAQDWAFYLQDMQLDPVPAGQEKTWIFEPEGFTKSHIVANEKEYAGRLIYAYGIHGPEIRSGGEPSLAGALQTRKGQIIPIHRSGAVEVEIRGNYNTLGWLPPLRDEEWWRATNLSNTPADMYSIVRHEIGHSLFFHPANHNFPRNRVLKDDAVRAYLGSDPRTDVHDHFDGFIDPWSLHGAFGNEYHGRTPYGRWLITRFDLLCAQAIGYKLRPLAPILPLSIRTENLPEASNRKPYKAAVQAQGGIPFYDWQISAGKLPPGLTLNRFTGQIIGTPRQVGRFTFTLLVRDYEKDGPTVSRDLEIAVART